MNGVYELAPPFTDKFLRWQNEEGYILSYISIAERWTITKPSGSIEDQVQQMLEDQVNPMVASHGGVVSLHVVEKTDVYLQFGGGCQGCGMIGVTMKEGVEVMLKENIPEISNVFDALTTQAGTIPVSEYRLSPFGNFGPIQNPYLNSLRRRIHEKDGNGFFPRQRSLP